MLTITNKKSPHYGKKGKLIQEIESEDLVLVYFREEELLCQFKKNEVKNQNNTKNIKQSKLPKSRKDFYFLITKKGTARSEIVSTIKALQKRNLFTINSKEHQQDEGITEKTLFDFIKDIQNSPSDIINQIRTFRDQGFIEFSLPNNSYNPRPETNNKKVTKKRRSPLKVVN